MKANLKELIDVLKNIYGFNRDAKSGFLNQGKNLTNLDKKINNHIDNILSSNQDYLLESLYKINTIDELLINDDELGLIEYLDKLEDEQCKVG